MIAEKMYNQYKLHEKLTYVYELIKKNTNFLLLLLE